MDSFISHTLYGWALVGGFSFVALLAMAAFFFIKGRADLRLAKQLAPLQATLTQLKADIESKSKELEGLIKERHEALIAIANADEARQFLKEHAGQVESMQARLEVLKENIAESNKRFLAAEKRCGEIEDELKERRESLAILYGKIEAAKKLWSSMESIKAIETDVWQELSTPVMPCITQHRSALLKSETAETAWLSAFDTMLKASGFEFNKRMLRAFHTGLKCGEATPLVVLAGISGTGKSLLPELYAVAAGMNFLSVPVQPRWDGPQDLLGFYNYMERRYKATELARFLWQADSWNNQEKKSRFRADALNIILLDEMNLARVEYYFSDFLSKLEQRRGINPDDLKQRGKAEILLECGAGLGELGKRKLFVGQNTFIVGTMNEDETTQMLSDKVIDRSNMLRFGRPAQLQAAPDKKKFFDVCENAPIVTHALWDSWQTPADEKHYYATKVADLNEAFATVGRPFGHRVTQSIAAYMANYPRVDDYEKVAFADQIEMKLLPKLNGLELSIPGFEDVANTIIGVVDEVGDDALREAFERARDTTHHSFFRWRGVMRT